MRTPPWRRWGSTSRLPSDPKALAFPWNDYRETLAYLRAQTSPATRVANLLHVVPALNGPAGRLTSLPAESLAWLAVHPEDERLFAPALQRAPAGSLVVWTPEKGQFVDLYGHYAEVERLAPVIRRHYVPIAHFGDIEVWKRTGGSHEWSRSAPPVTSHHAERDAYIKVVNSSRTGSSRPRPRRRSPRFP